MIDAAELKEVLKRAGEGYDFDNPETETNRWVADRLLEMVKAPGDALQIICASVFYSSLLVKKAGAPPTDPTDPQDYYELDPGGMDGPRLMVMQIFTAYLNGDEQMAYALARAAVLQDQTTAMRAVGSAVGFTIRAIRNPWRFVDGLEGPE